jgi:hypothetical protein
MSNDQIFRIGIGSIDEMGQAMQHNADHKNAPDLPKELLEKIAHLIQMITPNDPDLIPKAEPHCNCMHCQIARALTLGEEPVEEQIIEEEEDDEVVLDEELQFSQFEIEQMGNYLFHVKDKLAPFASFTVHLKDPVGCTCGKEGCEHVVAVLKS